MDMRTGRLYESEEAARVGGAVEVAQVQATGETITVLNGPFKGRVYERLSDGSRGRRRKDLE
jgi:hypothetical protein